MFKTNNYPFKKLAALTAAMIFAVSMASCGKTDDADDDDKGEKKTTTTTTAVAESPAEETVTEEAESVPESETETETTAVTTKPDGEDLPIDAMMSSIEADIPDITAWSGLGDASSPDTVNQTTTTTAAQSGSSPETTTTAAAVSADASSIKSEQQFIFEGKAYDNSTFTSAGVSVPSGWTEARTEKQFENSAYPYSYILEGQSKGATFIIGEAKGSGQTSFPSLTLYKGLTWGATVADIEAAYGTPAKEGHSEQYNTQLTNLFYSASDGSLIIYEISADWGLIAVNCCGK